MAKKKSFSIVATIRPIFITAFTFKLVLILLLTSCATKNPSVIELMPTPDVYDDGAINPLSDDDPTKKIPYGGMLYATDRQPADAEDHFYRNERGFLLRLGSARIVMGPEGISWEEARRLSLLKNRTDKYPLKVAAVNELGVLDRTYSGFTDPALVSPNPRQPAERFAEFVNAKLELSERKEIYVYIHGYKVVFENPLLVTTELWHFLGYDGVAIAYAWPSTPNKWAYFSDLETAALSAHNLRIFLEYLASETDAERIHIVGYSAGTRVVITALHQLALLHVDEGQQAMQKRLKIGHVILVGSDFDRELFGDYIIDGLLKVPSSFSVYTSATDKPLGISRWLFRRERLGQMWRGYKPPPAVSDFLNQQENLHIIDVTDAESAAAGNGHAYFRQSPWASSDILVTLMHDLEPAERGLIRSTELPVWQFPPDYIQNLRSTLIRVNPELKRGLETISTK